MIQAAQQRMLNLDGGWQVSIPLAKFKHAKQYNRVLRALGHEARDPEEVKEGWIVKWRPLKTASI